MARIGFDGLAISPEGKGHARTERHAAEALAAHTMLAAGLRELQDYVRTLHEESGSSESGRSKRLQRTERGFETVDRAFKQLAGLGIHPRP